MFYHFQTSNLFLSVLQLVAFRPEEKLDTKGHCLPSMAKLLLDPYIIIVAGFYFIALLAVSPLAKQAI